MSSAIKIPRGFPDGSAVKESDCDAIDARDADSIPGWGMTPWRKKGQLQYSCLRNPTDRGAWQATIHRVAQSWT